MQKVPQVARRLLCAVALFGAFAAVTPPALRTPLPPARLVDSYDQQIAALEAQYDSLGSQISSLKGQEAQVGAQVAAVQGQVSSTEANLSAVEAQINQLNIALAHTEESIQVDTAHLNSDKGQLAQLTVQVYTSGGGDSVVVSLVDSHNIGEFIDKLNSATTVSSQLQQLIGQVRADQAALDSLEQTQKSQLAEASQQQDQLQALEAQLKSQEAQLEAAEAALTGRAAQLVDQRQSIMGQINKVEAEQEAAEAAAAAAAAGGSIVLNGALAPFAFGPTNDLFPWGQCTWYVASLRNVTFGGNADAWFGNAQAAGYSTGETPKTGAIVVWGSGNGYSVFGHVAYVVGVSGPSSFTVDEANFFEIPGVLDQRRVTTLNDVEGFIY